MDAGCALKLFKRRTSILLDDEIIKNQSPLNYFEEIENITLVCSNKDNLKIYKGHLPINSISFNNNEKIKYYLNIKSNDN